jgi:hypothetical protein
MTPAGSKHQVADKRNSTLSKMRPKCLSTETHELGNFNIQARQIVPTSKLNQTTNQFHSSANRSSNANPMTVTEPEDHKSECLNTTPTPTMQLNTARASGKFPHR